jgi:hypothetical protein
VTPSPLAMAAAIDLSRVGVRRPHWAAAPGCPSVRGGLPGTPADNLRGRGQAPLPRPKLSKQMPCRVE